MNHELTIPEAVIGAAATILRQYKPEMSSVRDLLNNGIPEERDSEAESGTLEADR